MTRLAVCAAALVLLLAGSAGTVTRPLTGPISLVGVLVEQHGFGTRPGRIDTYRFSLASIRAKGRVFGWGVLSCQSMSAASSLRQCNGTFQLPRGRISVAGAFFYLPLFQLSVTGGTDAYIGVGGSVSFRQFADTTRNWWVTFNLV